MLQYILAGFGVLSNLSYIREVSFLFLQLFGVRYYTISSDRDFIRKVIRRLSKDCITTSQRIYSDLAYPSGLCVGSSVVGWIETDSQWLENWTVYLICKEDYFRSIREENYSMLAAGATDKEVSAEASVAADAGTVVKKEGTKMTIPMLWRRGTFEELRYGSTKIDVSDLMPLGNQRHAMTEILRIFQTKRAAKVFIHGAPGTGKSALGILLAKELNGLYCHTFDPTTPGDQWETLYGYYKDFSSDTPLIVVVEEANKLIEAVHHGRIDQHMKMPTPIKNKATWCNFMDDMVFYKNVIFILTSNQSKQEIDTLDTAYLRPGRVDLVLEMSTLICE